MEKLFGKIATARKTELSAAYDGGAHSATSGLVSGTRVAGRRGWRPVEAVAVGDEILTFDDGLQNVVRIRRTPYWTGHGACPEALWPLFVPAGAIGNRVEIWLLPEQLVIIENDAADELMGDAFAMIPAHTLEGYLGIERRAPCAEFELVTLYFEDEQVVFSNCGALFHCPAETDIVIDLFRPSERRSYKRPSLSIARQIAECIAIEFGAELCSTSDKIAAA